MESIRRPAVAGSFYPAETEELRKTLQHCFVSSPLGPQGATAPSPSLLGGLVPHAGFAYSGPCAAHLYSRLERDTVSILLLGVNHRGRGARAALSPADAWETPMGRVQIDHTIADLIAGEVDFLQKDERAHLQEHSIEVQLPFLQTVLGEFSFLPLCLSHLTEKECERLGNAVARACKTNRALDKKTLLIASSDLSHYLSPEETERLDILALEKILALDPAGLLRTVEEEEISMCGVIPTAVLLFAAVSLGAREARLLKHCHSGDVIPMREVVGYASVAIEF